MALPVHHSRAPTHDLQMRGSFTRSVNTSRVFPVDRHQRYEVRRLDECRCEAEPFDGEVRTVQFDMGQGVDLTLCDSG